MLKEINNAVGICLGVITFSCLGLLYLFGKMLLLPLDLLKRKDA